MNFKKYLLVTLASVALLLAVYYADLFLNPPIPAALPITGKVAEDTLQLTLNQVSEVQPRPIARMTFQDEKMAVGNVDFDQTNAVQVFTPYQGKIARVMVNAGDDVAKGQILYTVYVPDIAQATSNLISAGGVLKAANETLKRAQILVESRSISAKEFEQNVSDQQAAEASYKAAKSSLLLFGVTKAEVDEIIESKKVGIEMPVRSPISGRVVSRNAAPGLFVQPGNAPAPINIANLKKMWLLANVPEADIRDYKPGQSIVMTTNAYPDKKFDGTVRYVGDSSDSVTHRVLIRSEIEDPEHLLRAQMLADFRIKVSQARESLCLPIDALTRENDGSMVAWTQLDTIRFKRVKVKLGATQDGNVEILEGINEGEIVATKKSLFLDNLFTLTSN